MRLLIKSVIAAMLLAAAPVWAHDGHGNGYGHWKHGNKHQVREHYVVREYWRPVPVYPGPVYYPVYPAPAPGIHIVLPGLYIPLR